LPVPLGRPALQWGELTGVDRWRQR
jgi:hypothetical protein